jgi:hypothetical protein
MIEVTLMWGVDRNPLWTRHFTRDRVSIGDGATCATPAVPRFDVAIIDGALRVSAPAGAEVAKRGTATEVEYGAFTIAIASVDHEALPRGPRSRVSHVPMLYSVLGHMVVLGGMTHTPDDEPRPAAEAMKPYLARAAERDGSLEEHNVELVMRDWTVAPGEKDWAPTGSNSAGTRLAVGKGTGAAGGEGVVTDRDEVLRDAESFGMIALITSSTSSTLGAADTWASARSGGGTLGLWAVDGDIKMGAGLGPFGTSAGGAGAGSGIGLLSRGMTGLGSGVTWHESWERYHGGSYYPPHLPRSCEVVRYLEPVSHGPLEAKTIEHAFVGEHPAFEGCYATSMRTEGRFDGIVRLDLLIDHDGGVAATRDAGSTVPNPSVTDCFRRVASRVTFPERASTSRVECSMVLRSTCLATEESQRSHRPR